VGHEVRLQIGAARPAAGVSGNQSLPVPTVAAHHSLWQIILFAFLGGLILNVMPCVLPVIALKILGFVGQARDEPRRVRLFGLIYMLGVIVSFLILACVVVALQSAGATVGWGLQFSNPYFVIVMTVLVTLISLNLFGVFEVSAGGRTMAAASTLSSKHGAMGAFFNGLLTTVLATSCSAPILASAIGFAFTKSTGRIFIVMLSIALGLASPYLLLTWYPALLKFLPKPGAWMEKFKMAMGFPMLAAAIWLCSLVQIFYGERAWWMAMFLVFLAVAMWVYGEFVQRGRKHRLVAGGVAAVLLAFGYAYTLEYGMRWREQVKAAAREEAPSEVPRGLKWQKWSAEAVADARAKGQVVVVDFTAKWCVNCNLIVKPAFESESVQQKIAEIGAVPFVADFTLFPADIADELKRFDRSGVPLVLVYPKNPSEPPKVLDLVSSGTLVAALDQAAR
jgi:thiol:disulfide interchange protein DsbD